MRITFVMPFAGTAGGTRVVAKHAEGLRLRGHAVTVVSTPRRDPGLRAKFRSLVKGDGWPAALGPSHFDRVNVNHRIIERYRPIVDSDLPDADVVIATWWETAEWVAALEPVKGAPMYFIQHDETQFNQPAERVIATWKLPMRKLAVAQWLVELGKERCPGETITLIPNAVDLEQFNAPPRGKQARPTVGVMYSQAAFKGCDIAFSAFEMARKNVPELQLVSFGSQDPNDSLPIPPGAKYLKNPPQEQLKDFYSACDAWLFASLSEGFGLPILEAMACRTPVIATPAGAAPELIAPGGGISVRPEDASDMAVAIERIAAMPESEWNHLSDAAFATASANTWDHATGLFEAAVQSCESNRPIESTRK